MSQTTFDAAAPSGAPDDSNESRAKNTPTRKRPPRRGHASGAKSAEVVAQAPQSAAPEHEAPAASPVTATEEQGARGEPHRSRGRGGAKRPATRGKGAQLIIPKTDEAPVEASTPGDVSATALATETAVVVPVVPVVSSAPTRETAETPALAPVRKTRFGLPRRYQQPGMTPAAPVSVAPASEIPVEAAASVEPEPIAPVAPIEDFKATPRYRFDRMRAAAATTAAPRPERLASRGSGLYTVATSPDEAPAQVFDLPPLDALVDAESDLPSLSFETPVAVPEAPAESASVTPVETVAEAEALDEAPEATEAPESGDGAVGASRRRRRRRRGSPVHADAHEAEQDETAEEELPATPEFEPLDGLDFEPQPSEPVYSPRESRGAQPEGGRSRGGRSGYTSRVPRQPAAEPAWESVQQTVDASPYGSPEPAFARGFGPTPAGVATPARETYPRPSRVERGQDAGAANMAQVGAVIREAISTQTDRLLNELRRQQPPAVTLSLPNTGTTERVAIFVDVANVVYSARSMRTAVDFGHLLDFLRANRRLARAQAYAPTNPEPGADQAFLSAVKGMGYRITTKNYKTFSNGAKKADLDLDLCMDIVRIVDAKAVDTIVLVSGDSDFLPLLDYCSDHGVRVEVAAFDDAASMILRQSCDLFVNLSLVDGIRG